MAEKCHRTGKTVYAMDEPIKIGGLVFSKAGFTCAATGAKLTLRNAVVYDGDVYHERHVPKDKPSSEAGIDLNTATAMANQSQTSAPKGQYTGKEGSGFAHIPDHVKQAKELGSGFSGTRNI